MLHRGLGQTGEALEHSLQGVRRDVPLHAEGEGLAPLAAQGRAERRLPGGLGRSDRVLRAQVPARDAQQVPRAQLRLLAHLEQRERVRRAVEQGEHDGRAVAVLGGEVRGEGPQGVPIPLLAGVHGEQRLGDAQLELQRGVVEPLEGEGVRLARGLEVTGRVEQAGEPHAACAKGRVHLDRALEGLPRRTEGPEPPAGVSEQRPGCGAPIGGEGRVVTKTKEPLLERRELAVLGHAGPIQPVGRLAAGREEGCLEVLGGLRRRGSGPRGEDGEQEEGRVHAAAPAGASSGRRRR